MDVLVLKKERDVDIEYDIGRIFRGHNVIEYKSPDDELSIDDFAKTMSYAFLYKALGRTIDERPFDDLTATMYRHAYPRELFRRLQEHGAVIEEKYKSVYYVSGMVPFPVQIIVGRELDPEVYSMLRVLTPGAREEDIRNFAKVASGREDAGYRRFADNVYQVSVSANREKYDELKKEDPEMCEALRDLFKDELAEERNKGEIKGEIKGAIKAYYEVGILPSDIIIRIVSRFSLKREEAEQYVEQTLGLEKV